jgi:16S rRNA (cytosine967-C5)-methyltransferase
MVGEIVDLQPGESFLDVCAAPGSKLTQIATMTEAAVTGGDINFQRAAFIVESAKRQGLKNVSVLQFDSSAALPFASDSFDVVLVDAPCSGTGTIRNNPEIRYTLSESDFLGLSHRQLEILSNAANCVKPGGRLIYSTCSLETEENEMVIEEFLRNEGRFVRIDAAADPSYVTGRGFVRTFPDRDSIAGFFVAALRKIN